MTNNTQIYWQANGLSLHTYAWSVATFGGQRYAPAPKRGDNLLLPLRHGNRYLPKLKDSQEISLEMWVLPVSPDTGLKYPDLTLEQGLHKNWKTLLDAIDVPGQFLLTKRWYDSAGVIQTANAQAEFLEGMVPSTTGGYRQEFTVDLMLADPFFYGTEETSFGGTFTVKGDYITDRVVLELVVSGNARVEFSDGNWFTYTGPPCTLYVDSYKGIVTKTATNDADVPVNGLMEKNKDFGSYALLTPGTFTVSFVYGVEEGSTIKYFPAYR